MQCQIVALHRCCVSNILQKRGTSLCPITLSTKAIESPILTRLLYLSTTEEYLSSTEAIYSLILTRICLYQSFLKAKMPSQPSIKSWEGLLAGSVPQSENQL